jgi:hypothetical protein
MRRIEIVASSLALAAAVAVVMSPGADAAKYVSWEGSWHLNKAETHYPAGVLVTDNDILVARDTGETLTYIETVVNNGKSSTQAYDGAYDGKPYYVGNGETMTFRHISATSYSAVRHNKDGFVLERSVFVLSNHGRKLTCHAWARQPGGKPIKFDEIFDKGV